MNMKLVLKAVFVAGTAAIVVFGGLALLSRGKDNSEEIEEEAVIG